VVDGHLVTHMASHRGISRYRIVCTILNRVQRVEKILDSNEAVPPNLLFVEIDVLLNDNLRDLQECGGSVWGGTERGPLTSDLITADRAFGNASLAVVRILCSQGEA
jgi:hypothetical protein